MYEYMSLLFDILHHKEHQIQEAQDKYRKKTYPYTPCHSRKGKL